MRRVLFPWLLGALALLEATTASAQDTETALARSLFEQGIELADRGDWTGAADRFRRSLEIRPSPVVAYNLGNALTEIGRFVEASEAFRRAIRADDAELRTAAQGRLDAIQPRIGTLIIQLDGPGEGVTVMIDGDPIPSQAIGIGTPIDPGEHAVDARRGGGSVAETTVTIAEGGSDEVTLEIPPAPVEDRGSGASDPVLGGGGSTEPVDESGGISPWLWVGIGAAVAAGVAVLLVVLLTQSSDADPVSGTLSPPFVEF